MYHVNLKNVESGTVAFWIQAHADVLRSYETTEAEAEIAIQQMQFLLDVLKEAASYEDV